MQPLEIKKDIFWVGAVDYASRDFHGYSLSPQGTTYNAYVVKDEKNVLFDTVKHEYAGTLVERLTRVMDPEKNRLPRRQPCGTRPLRRLAPSHRPVPARDGFLLAHGPKGH
jgi:hypothetical protein